MSQIGFYVIPFLAYVFVANPATYKIVRKVLGGWVANAEGLATFPGLLLHAFVFVLLVSLLMRFFPQVSGFDGAPIDSGSPRPRRGGRDRPERSPRPARSPRPERREKDLGRRIKNAMDAFAEP